MDLVFFRVVTLFLCIIAYMQIKNVFWASSLSARRSVHLFTLMPVLFRYQTDLNQI